VSGGQRTGQPAIVVSTLLCALLGGLLADRISPLVPGPGRVAVVALCTVAGACLAFFLLTRAGPDSRHRAEPVHRERPPDVRRPSTGQGATRRPSGQRAPEDWWTQPPPGAAPPGGAALTGAALPGGAALAGADAPGPARPGAAPHGPGRGEPWTRPAPPLSGYDEQSPLIAQCPHCGDFRLDVSGPDFSGPDVGDREVSCPETGVDARSHHRGRPDAGQGVPAYAFRCRNPSCAHTWSWTPGSSWPAVVVRRNLTGSPAADRAGIERR
jgi:hypothetical protein